VVIVSLDSGLRAYVATECDWSDPATGDRLDVAEVDDGLVVHSTVGCANEAIDLRTTLQHRWGEDCDGRSRHEVPWCEGLRLKRHLVGEGVYEAGGVACCLACGLLTGVVIVSCA